MAIYIVDNYVDVDVPSLVEAESVEEVMNLTYSKTSFGNEKLFLSEPVSEMFGDDEHRFKRTKTEVRYKMEENFSVCLGTIIENSSASHMEKLLHELKEGSSSWL